MLLSGAGRLAPAGRSPWAVHVVDGRIAWVGQPDEAPDDDDRVDLGTALVTPGLVDAHTHPAFAGDRSDEAAARLEGATYDGGGILRTVELTRAAGDDELIEAVTARLRAALRAGTTTVECKSGYGLTVADELRQLRIIRRAADGLPLRVIPTLLGAHAVPPDGSATEHAALVADEMIPAVAEEGLAAFVDVFVDRDFYAAADAERIGRAAAAHGLGVRLHADQLSRTGAAELGVRLGASSVDHLEQLDERGVEALAGSGTVATLLPAPAIVLRDRLPPARALLDAGVTVALASDANAGTYGGFGTMPAIVALGATLLDMTMSEALTAATAGGAASLRRDDLGRVEVGAQADLVAWDAEHEGAFALRLGAIRPHRAWISGEEVDLGERSGPGAG